MTMRYKILTILFGLLVGCTAMYPNTQDTQEEAIDVKEIIFGHIGNSYEWHITHIGNMDFSIPLPVIVYSNEQGWKCFLSSEFKKAENGEYQGFYISQSAENEGKVCERINGQEVRPVLDISITKNVMQLWIVVALMLIVFLSCARWYRNKKPGDAAPKGFVGLIEMFVMMVNDEIIKSCIGEKHYRPYAPYLLTVFFFIFFSNILGLVPIFPGGANLTGNITVTFFLAMGTFLLINLSGNKTYWKEILWPDVPLLLKFPIPLMPVIEIFGIFTKPLSLMIRLFANILAGHAMVLSLTCIIFITFQVGAVIGTTLSTVSVFMMIFMDFLELLVAFIQACVFTLLSSVFIGLAHQEEE